MYKAYISLLVYLISCLCLFSQDEKNEKLDKILITSSNIDIPFTQKSKAITIINAIDIKNSTATNLTDLLQQVASIDVRRRGLKGTQSDLYIRGGNFEQTLILIDGIKTSDPQSGHHTMNMMIPLENIERVEIVKGASARVFGQNAFTGAINIVTKKMEKDILTLDINLGSFSSYGMSGSIVKKFKKSNHLLSLVYQNSDGYRPNSDFINQHAFYKGSFLTKNEAVNIIASFGSRNFGAQYFYTSPSSNFTEYEETRTSLLGVSTKYHFNDLTIKPKLYWKRGQDEFLLKRGNPDFSRNFNVSNKIGATLNSSYKNEFGITGIGVDVAMVSLESNNLGNQKRTQVSAFFEHRLESIDRKVDVTPGVSVHQYSDFGFHAFPGIDLGFKVSDKSRVYWNLGTSFRIPTYTEMYINIPNFLQGDSYLNPEKAIVYESGFTYKNSLFELNSAVFHRITKDLIDYVKETSRSPFYKAKNLRKIITNGFELNGKYHFKINKYKQAIDFGYTFMDDNYEDINVFKSRYLVNSSMKHQVTANLKTQFIKNVSQSVSYRFVERPTNSYTVFDAKVNTTIKSFTIYGIANNIFDVDYFEKEFIEMPKSNFELGIKYIFD